MRQLLEAVFTAYYKDVYTYLYSLCRDASLAEDLAQEVFLEAVRSITSFRGDAEVKTWLFSIARHKWYGYLRKKGRQEAKNAVLLQPDFPGKNPEEQYLDKEALARFYELLHLESERTQTIVQMRLEGYSFYEISRRCQISESSARVIDFRTKHKLREILKKEGFIHESDQL